VGVHKRYVQRGVETIVARDLSFRFEPGQSVALLGRNGAGKSSLLRMIAGLMDPDAGVIRHEGTVSWPVGFQGSFHPDLTGAENARFVARIYGLSPRAMERFVGEVAELGPHLRLPVRSYSAGMKARLAFAVSMAVPFDTYLIDEVTSVGDGAFRLRSEALLRDRLRSAGAIVVSHATEMLRRMCDAGVVLEKGRMFYYSRVDKAIEHHDHLMRGQLPPWMR
jgi:capsular polysaccharide transport system ATP-binding protein